MGNPSVLWLIISLVYSITFVFTQQPGQIGIQIENINNDNPFLSKSEIVRGNKEYPVIFEPIRNIRLSRSAYKVTTFIDLQPYLDYFDKYEKFLNQFAEDLKDRGKMSFLVRYHESLKRQTGNEPKGISQWLHKFNCSDPDHCLKDRYTYTVQQCYNIFLSVCSTQRQF